MADLTTEEFWTKLGRKIPKPGDKTTDMEFRWIFEKYLFPQYSKLTKRGKVKKKRMLEIGCVPGTFMAYFANKFGYFPEGVDFDRYTIPITSQTLRNFGVEKFGIYRADFNKWNPKRKYDLVFSLGFIEHFDNPEEIVRRHIKLLKKGGKLIIEIPNFGGFNGFLHKLVDRPNLEKHNTRIMNLDFFREIVQEHNLKVLYLDYFGSWHFQWGYGRLKTANIFQIGIYALLKLISKLTIDIRGMRNQMSNYILLIAERK